MWFSTARVLAAILRSSGMMAWTGGPSTSATDRMSRSFPASTSGQSFPISRRISQWKIQDFSAKNFKTPAELEGFVDPWADAGVGLPLLTASLLGKRIRLRSQPCRLDEKALGQAGNLRRIGRHDGRTHRHADGPAEQFPDWPQKVREGRMDELLSWNPEVLTTLA